MLPIDPFHELALAASVWFLIHPLVAGSALRDTLVRRLGERGFRGVFALLSLAAFGWLLASYAGTPCVPLWVVPAPLYYLPILVVPPAFALLAGAFTVPNPTAAGGERALERVDAARGVLRITRHPFLVAVAAWALVHVVVNANLASSLFFGSFFLTALVGTRDIDRKRARLHPEAFAHFRSQTSVLPFLAILRGRNRLVLRELVVPLAVGAVLTTALLLLHETWFYVSPFPR
jgi:uncharacterized membrane protein